MRGFGKLAAVSGRPITAPASAAVASYSTLSGGGGGRGRGRGSGTPSRVPDKLDSNAGDDDDLFAPPGVGRGRGQPVLSSSPVLPSFSSWISSEKPAVGRGRGRLAPSPPDSSETSSDMLPKKSIFFKREDVSASPVEKPEFADADEVDSIPRSLSSGLSGAGRGKPTRSAEPDSRTREENRHLRPRAAPRSGLGTSDQTSSQPRMGREEAVRKAVEVLSRGAPGGGRGPGRGRGGRAMMRGRGRGGRFRGRGAGEADEDIGIYLGDNADGEKLKKRLGEEKMKELSEAFDEMSRRALPSPFEDAYLDALHTNNMVCQATFVILCKLPSLLSCSSLIFLFVQIEYEPEYLVDFDNPDIDEKPPMSLLEALEKAKPFLMAYEGIQSQEEWEVICCAVGLF
ncbi:hypothetical protein BHE74_00053524 [Ensete ventricosum]|uniref:Uncharacterized protein n=1 Tax=Ensete ventricosum TaxID=4639 RepID=A0A427AQL6_ENSVE|nr:hypothetical protein B296_00026607 [Ensete ventricosum]RWW41016.1 hypothetical protein BHE74_00053524 [Ensete ventricosum]RZR89727.1 hypothetical protein BHM03_00017497 [Ensete ventricosum]